MTEIIPVLAHLPASSVTLARGAMLDQEGHRAAEPSPR
jgi:hypothetical protein